MEWLIGLLIMFLVLFLSLWIKEKAGHIKTHNHNIYERREWINEIADLKFTNGIQAKTIEKYEQDLEVCHKNLDNKTADKKITQEEK